MRKNNVMITEESLMFAVGGQLFSQAPNRNPRKAEIIMKKIKEAFRREATNDNEYYTLVVEDMYKYIEDLLMGIKEFTELNLSQNEYEDGINVDDENRSKYLFTSSLDIETSESWRDDFVDLDAFIRNVYTNMNMIEEYYKDCFCCVYNKDDLSEKCVSCKINPRLRDNYECERKPKGRYTFACKFNCYKNRYICCEECDDKKECKEICISNSKECNLALNRLSGKNLKEN